MGVYVYRTENKSQTVKLNDGTSVRAWNTSYLCRYTDYMGMGIVDAKDTARYQRMINKAKEWAQKNGIEYVIIESASVKSVYRVDSQYRGYFFDSDLPGKLVATINKD